ncbi:epoxide hydrolase [Amycolatopsis balhimycina DSM 5908]|uniref:Epoxide hydrolase n=1 Tax=Amycolatopsis balhimycina DSM 5908 TaxID=1081091 RepID=A0A428WP91_AMYBA|nr:epoxide hydrolase family protein [Amycolatopsis balhimycina]RSM44901.1 epoxide hydrolase [Amycolatopsis balhimycina DSM 5908]
MHSTLTTDIEQFPIHVPQGDLDDLRTRLALTRWPGIETVTDTSQGPTTGAIRALTGYWAETYNWRRAEALLNSMGSSHTTIDGLDIHFLHVRSPEADALPLLMTHGWPSSVLDFAKTVGPLTDPAAHRSDPRQAFHLVIPSLPGFGFSAQPDTTGWGFPRIADAWITLMDRLGYDRWGAHGGDLGTAVTNTIAAKGIPQLAGIHLSMGMFGPDPDEIADATPEEQAMLASAGHFWDKLSGYAKEQGTRPQTIGYSLADSPVGLAAWIYAMFQDTCATPGDAPASFTYDELLDAIMMYWLPNAGVSSARIYWDMLNGGAPAPVTAASPIAVPTGFIQLAGEHVRKTRRWIERRYTDLVHFAEGPGGHFAALENPEALIDSIRATFATLR